MTRPVWPMVLEGPEPVQVPSLVSTKWLQIPRGHNRLAARAERVRPGPRCSLRPRRSTFPARSGSGGPERPNRPKSRAGDFARHRVLCIKRKSGGFFLAGLFGWLCGWRSFGLLEQADLFADHFRSNNIRPLELLSPFREVIHRFEHDFFHN